uniref:Uncharacterized protein n=1 Tax=Amphimedon queenslandica TaxID=400682 RepID=A0A1X7UKK9_AMPQE
MVNGLRNNRVYNELNQEWLLTSDDSTKLPFVQYYVERFEVMSVIDRCLNYIQQKEQNCLQQEHQTHVEVF